MDPESPMSNLPQCLIHVDRRGSAIVLSCAGAIDMLTAPELEQAIDDALLQTPTALIIDLTLVDFFSSRGMSVLIATQDRCSSDVRFAVVADGPITLRPMTLMGLNDILSLNPTLADALIDVQV
jgi:anti-sigma B factor antagonist